LNSAGADEWSFRSRTVRCTNPVSPQSGRRNPIATVIH